MIHICGNVLCEIFEKVVANKDISIPRNEITQSIQRNDLFETTRTGEVDRTRSNIKNKENKYRNPTRKGNQEI